MNESTLKLPSFAKINRTLRVLGKRPDGFHEIDSNLQTVSLHDELTFTPRDDQEIVLNCDTPGIPTDSSNLILRAALALRRLVPEASGVSVQLTKHIPAQGGLGGASSNAAVTLLALNQLWRAGLDHGRLQDLASQLGSDVPFFFWGGSGRAKGTGTVITMLPDEPKSYLIIVTPNAKVSTSIAYTALKAPSLTTQGSVSILSSSFADPPFGDHDQRALYNDFEGVIFEIEPEIKRAKLALLEAGAQGGLMAGSGSSVFGTFEKESERERALKVLRRETGWQVFSCNTISRAEYCEALNSIGFPILTLS
ncbi:MAG TPA: 4-(cytidine 5'-diphospho)-2-C-methyl-D-erythritol kinase [Pyrinomonadaceae bacterium]|nr:4-(cytidine 5'-diphospho)-2-C-methyl-D-erythritol kinase [Pyrinomonadaceae bacterium]